MFLDQDYGGEHTLYIYNNSNIEQELAIGEQLPYNKSILLINENIDSSTNLPYTSLGAIYNDLIRYVPTQEDDVVIFWDDDDLFLPSHISRGVDGLIRGGKRAYKPSHSFYRSPDGVFKVNNTLEPSIFVYSKDVKREGFSDTTTEQHLKWLTPLIEKGEVYVDPEGESTMIYNWGDTHIFTFKTSGDFHNPANFDNYRRSSRDHGDKLITPLPKEQITKYYKTEVNAS